MYAWLVYCHQDLSSWDVLNVTSMKGMFSGGPSFGQDFLSWDVSRVLFMDTMFRNASSFNQDLSSWNVSGINKPRDLFNGAPSFQPSLCLEYAMLVERLSWSCWVFIGLACPVIDSPVFLTDATSDGTIWATGGQGWGGCVRTWIEPKTMWTHFIQFSFLQNDREDSGVELDEGWYWGEGVLSVSQKRRSCQAKIQCITAGLATAMESAMVVGWPDYWVMVAWAGINKRNNAAMKTKTIEVN
jgi:hypothetical protein